MNGIELCRHIRSSGFMNYIYVILFTTSRAPSDSIEAMSAGADDFMVQPLQPAELTLRICAGQRLLGLETRDLLIFAMAKLAELATPTPAPTWSACGPIRGSSRSISHASQDSAA